MLEHVREQLLADAGDVDRVLDFFVLTPLHQMRCFRFADAFDHKDVFGLAFVEQSEQLRAISRFHSFHLPCSFLLQRRSGFT